MMKKVMLSIAAIMIVSCFGVSYAQQDGSEAVTPSDPNKQMEEVRKALEEMQKDADPNEREEIGKALKEMEGERPGRRGSQFDKQFSMELQKHRQRLAKLDRIRELTAAKGDEKALERIDSLIEKENVRHNRKRRQIGMHREGIDPNEVGDPNRKGRERPRTRHEGTERPERGERPQRGRGEGRRETGDSNDK